MRILSEERVLMMALDAQRKANAPRLPLYQRFPVTTLFMGLMLINLVCTWVMG